MPMSCNEMDDLLGARITSLPDDAFYIADFISEEEEESLLQKVSSFHLIRESRTNKRCR